MRRVEANSVQVKAQLRASKGGLHAWDGVLAVVWGRVAAVAHVGRGLTDIGLLPTPCLKLSRILPGLPFRPNHLLVQVAIPV